MLIYGFCVLGFGYTRKYKMEGEQKNAKCDRQDMV